MGRERDDGAGTTPQSSLVVEKREILALFVLQFLFFFFPMLSHDCGTGGHF